MKHAKSGHVSPVTLARIARALKKHGVRHKDVAEEATKTSPRGHVSESMVTRVLGGHSKSANVVATAKRMIAGSTARRGTADAEAGRSGAGNAASSLTTAVLG